MQQLRVSGADTGLAIMNSVALSGSSLRTLSGCNGWTDLAAAKEFRSRYRQPELTNVYKAALHRLLYILSPRLKPSSCLACAITSLASVKADSR